MQCWYLCNSGFAVHTGSRMMVFDYFLDTPKGGGLDAGVINPAELRALSVPVTVFASHRHFDHFNRKILRWPALVPGLRVILSDDIKADGAAVRIGPGETAELEDGVTVRALRSTDLGVAFLVRADGLCIYHAGDLNWWHWEGEPDDFNRTMEQDYKAEIDRLRGEAIDLAFVPVDPRLGEAFTKGIAYFMETVGARAVVPMHFGSDFTVMERLLADAAAAPFRDKIIPLSRRGQRFEPELPPARQGE